jgi:hypothetical protein
VFLLHSPRLQYLWKGKSAPAIDVQNGKKIAAVVDVSSSLFCSLYVWFSSVFDHETLFLASKIGEIYRS